MGLAELTENGGRDTQSPNGDQTVGDRSESGLDSLRILEGFRHSRGEGRNGVRRGDSQK